MYFNKTHIMFYLIHCTVLPQITDLLQLVTDRRSKHFSRHIAACRAYVRTCVLRAIHGKTKTPEVIKRARNTSPRSSGHPTSTFARHARTINAERAKLGMATRQQATAAATLAFLLLSVSAASSSSSPALLTTSAAASRKVLHWNAFCPWDAVKFGACVGVLGAAGLQAGAQLGSKCCDVVQGLAAAEAAACFCTTVKETVLGIPTEWDVGVGVLASACKTELPDGFKCV